MIVLIALLQVLFLVRHAEKVDNSRDAALSAAGEARARALAEKLRDSGITAIFATQYQRTQKTAAPVAARLKLPVATHPADDTKGLIELLRKQERALVVGHANTLPEIGKAFGVTFDVPDEEFDGLYVVFPAERLVLRLHQ